MYRNFKYILIMILSLLTGTFSVFVSFALPTDGKQTLHIDSDSSFFNYQSGINLYEGNVKINQGTTHLSADRVITKNNAKHTMEEAIAYGINQLAEYSTLPKEKDAILIAKAKIIKYYPLTSIVKLEGDVIVTQGKNSFRGPHIIYNMKEQIVVAPPSQGGRASIVIEPNQLKL